MDRGELYEILDFILNRADSSELEAIRKALERRLRGPAGPGHLGIDARGMAEETARTVAGQVTWSSDYIRSMVRDFAGDIIRKNAPELGDGDVETLLDSWLSEDTAPERDLPPDLLKTMVKQFIAYATGVMSASEQVTLNEEMPDWTEKYWKNFPENVRRLVSLFLTGKLEEERFLEYLDSLLDYD